MEKANGEGANLRVPAFISSRGEEVVFAKRKHLLFLILPLFVTIAFALAFSFLSFLFFVAFTSSFDLFILTLSLINISAIILISKIIADWYFHLYVVTTRKILEVRSTPLFSHTVNEILLNQVRCTEIDVKRDGILNELLDMGNVMLTFDRPTHQEEFIIANIKNPQEIGFFLCTLLETTEKEEAIKAMWFKQRNKKQLFRFSQEIFPTRPLVGT